MVEIPSEASHRGQTVSSKQEAESISLYKQLRLGLSSTYYSMAQVLGLRRLQDYMQVGTTPQYVMQLVSDSNQLNTLQILNVVLKRYIHRSGQD